MRGIENELLEGEYLKSVKAMPPEAPAEEARKKTGSSLAKRSLKIGFTIICPQ